MPELKNSKDWAKVTQEERNKYCLGLDQDWKVIRNSLQGAFNDQKGDTFLVNGLPEAVYHLFSTKADGSALMTYEQFSSTNFDLQKGIPSHGYLSLEFVHDNMHDWCGGAGYMGDPGTAAFDPISGKHCDILYLADLELI